MIGIKVNLCKFKWAIYHYLPLHLSLCSPLRLIVYLTTHIHSHCDYDDHGHGHSSLEDNAEVDEEVETEVVVGGNGIEVLPD